MRNNLPPESQPWARDIEQRVNQLERQASRAEQDSKNAIEMLNLRVTQIINQQTYLDESSELVVRDAHITYPQGALSRDYSVEFVRPEWASAALLTVTTGRPTGAINPIESAFVTGSVFATNRIIGQLDPTKPTFEFSAETFAMSSDHADGWSASGIIRMDDSTALSIEHTVSRSFVTSYDIEFSQAFHVIWI